MGASQAWREVDELLDDMAGFRRAIEPIERSGQEEVDVMSVRVPLFHRASASYTERTAAAATATIYLVDIRKDFVESLHSGQSVLVAAVRTATSDWRQRLREHDASRTERG